MTQVEFDFLADQRGPRKMFCENVVDAHWKKTAERREREELAFKRREERARDEVKRMEKVELTDCMVDEVFQTLCQANDEDYLPDEEEEEKDDTSLPTKRRRMLKSASEIENAEIAEKYRHLRLSILKVKPEYYSTIVTLKTKFHCSDTQAVAGVVLTGKNLFDLPWKFFDSDKECIDLDTAPCSSNNRREGRIRELFTLAEVVKKIMNTDGKASITYHDDGSKKQGTGAFSVQGISINGVYYPLPTLSIAAESRTNLVDLKVLL